LFAVRLSRASSRRPSRRDSEWAAPMLAFCPCTSPFGQVLPYISHVHGSVSHAACLVLNMSRLCQHRDLHRHGGRRLQGQGWCPTDHISCYISPSGCAGKPRRCDCRTAGLAGAAQRCVGLVRPPAVRPRHAARIRGSGGIPSQPRQASSRETCRGGSCVGWDSRAV
jgi:hypothetical protein